MSEPEPPGLGCYGVQLHGLPDASQSMLQLPAGSPRFDVERVDLAATRAPEFLTGDAALLHLSDGTGVAQVDRTKGAVRLAIQPGYTDEAILHPLITGTAAAINWWLGRDSFHGGAFVVGGRAWAVLGAKGDGKSSTLAYLAMQGVPVVTDDLLVEDDGFLLAGPSFVDLRPDAATSMGLGRDLGFVGNRFRARLDVPRSEPRVPLAGWVTLRWGSEVRLSTTQLDDRIKTLYAQRSVRRPPLDPSKYLGYAAKPFLSLERPKSWACMPRVLDLLTTTLPGHSE